MLRQCNYFLPRPRQSHLIIPSIPYTPSLSDVTSSHNNSIMDQHFSVIHGEDTIPQPICTRISVRPHPGDTLGRCVALVI